MENKSQLALFKWILIGNVIMIILILYLYWCVYTIHVVYHCAPSLINDFIVYGEAHFEYNGAADPFFY